MAESFESNVTDNITPAACKATLTGDHVIEYGDILAGSLSKDDFTILPVKSTNFSIICEALAKMGIQTTDNRLGTNNNPIGQTLANLAVSGNTALMGLGTDAKGNKLGALQARCFFTLATVTISGCSI